jgi:nitrite reductase/ring-hydroxylating ferredoxin subunit
VCDLNTIGRVATMSVQSDKGAYPLLLVRDGEKIRAYVNACPHQYLPLDHRGDQLLSADGRMLMCTAHGARFDLRTGEAINGADCGLDAVPVKIVGDTLLIADEPVD